MRRAAIVFAIGLIISIIFSGCGSLTQKSKLYDLLYDFYTKGAKGSVKVTPDKADCMAEKVIAKLSDKEIDNLTKALELLDGGYEIEVMSSKEYANVILTVTEYERTAFFECQ